MRYPQLARPLPSPLLAFAALCGAALVGAADCGRNTRTLSPPVPQIWAGWILFDQPESTSVLGLGYSLAGAVETTCYAVGKAEINPSLDTFSVSWDRRTKGSLAADVAKVLGISAAASAARRGSIQFENVVVERIEDPRPIPNCADARFDGMPKLPVVVALLGASRFRYELTNERGVSLNAAAAKELANKFGASASATDTTKKVSVVSFSTRRYIAAQFYAFEPDTVKDSVTSAHTPMGTPVTIRDWAHVTAYRDSATDAVRLVVKSIGPGAVRVDTVVNVVDRDMFPVLRKAKEGVSGSYTTGQFYYGPDHREYMLTVVRRNLITHRWNQAAQRDLVRRWVGTQ